MSQDKPETDHPATTPAEPTSAEPAAAQTAAAEPATAVEPTAAAPAAPTTAAPKTPAAAKPAPAQAAPAQAARTEAGEPAAEPVADEAVTATTDAPAAAVAASTVPAPAFTGYPAPTAGVDAPVDAETAVLATVGGPSLVARIGAELFGTFVVLLAGFGTFLFSSYSGAGTLGVALAFGFGTIAAMTAVGHLSGGHFNPAVTLGSAIAGRTRWADVLPYWLAQLVGGALASAVVFVVLSSFAPFEGAERTQFSALANGYDIHTPLVRSTDGSTAIAGLGLLGALVLEAVLTAVLVGVLLSITSRRKSERVAPVAVGLTLSLAMLIAIPLTNGGLNPARSLAAALFSDSWAWGQIWVFVVAPLVGAALAGLLFRAFSSPRIDEDDLLLDDEDLELEELDAEIELR